MIRERFHFRETFATILADDPAHAAAAKAGILAARQDLEAYIARDPFFASTYEPYEPDTDAEVIHSVDNTDAFPFVIQLKEVNKELPQRSAQLVKGQWFAVVQIIPLRDMYRDLAIDIEVDPGGITIVPTQAQQSRELFGILDQDQGNIFGGDVG